MTTDWILFVEKYGPSISNYSNVSGISIVYYGPAYGAVYTGPPQSVTYTSGVDNPSSTTPVSLSMGVKTVIVDQQLNGLFDSFTLNMNGSLDLPYTVVSVQIVNNNITTTLLNSAFVNVDFIGMYGMNSPGAKLVLWDDINKSYTVLFESPVPLPADRLVVSLFTPVPFLDTAVTTATCAYSFTYYNGLKSVMQSELIPVAATQQGGTITNVENWFARNQI